MKKFAKIALAALLACSITACGGSESKEEESNKLVVSATANPHEVILKQAQTILAEDYDIEMEIKVLDDYYIFNKALDNEEVDANYFQHRPFFDEDVEKNGYEIVEAGAIHLEPFGFYSQVISSKDELKDGAEIIISNSVADHGRILAILAKEGIITLKEGTDELTATVKDIESNPKNLKFSEIKPELLATAYTNKQGDMVAINGNYALQAGLNPMKDAIILEQATDDNPYVNIVACKKGKESSEKIKALVEVLKSEEIEKFITEEYQGSVIVAQ